MSSEINSRNRIIYIYLHNFWIDLAYILYKTKLNMLSIIILRAVTQLEI